MYRIAYLLSSKIYYSENLVGLHITIRLQKQVNYNRKGNRGLHSPGVGRRSIMGNGPVTKDIKYRIPKIEEKLFTITEMLQKCVYEQKYWL